MTLNKKNIMDLLDYTYMTKRISNIFYSNTVSIWIVNIESYCSSTTIQLLPYFNLRFRVRTLRPQPFAP